MDEQDEAKDSRVKGVTNESGYIGLIGKGEGTGRQGTEIGVVEEGSIIGKGGNRRHFESGFRWEKMKIEKIRVVTVKR